MKYIIAFTLLVNTSILLAQSTKIFYTKTGTISFFSEAPMENIEAINNYVVCAFDINSGKIEFKVPITKFEFDKALMQEHFNENYLESEKFPHAIFKGKINNAQQFDFNKPGEYKVSVKGKMTIHGVEQNFESKGTINVSENEIMLNAAFNITIKDYKIKIPKMVIKNIAEVVDVTVSGTLVPLK